ncbi:MAG: hypothetical protein IT244_12550 [Bacteroidia bacterium]|nr:hypothetical protein [Bacteroidia bacterium]
MPIPKRLKTCNMGHRFYKSSDCPVCPICEKAKAEQHAFAILPAPARRALDNAGIASIEKLSSYTEKEILNLHGMGKGSMPKLKQVLAEAGMSFKLQE